MSDLTIFERFQKQIEQQVRIGGNSSGHAEILSVIVEFNKRCTMLEDKIKVLEEQIKELESKKGSKK